MIWGNFFITTACFALIMLWIFEGNYKEKFKLLLYRKTPIFFILIGIVIFGWAAWQLPHPKSIRDLWENLPLLIFALVLGSKPQLTRNEFHTILLVYIFSIVINTIYNFTYFLLTAETFQDIRSVSQFMSYIRLALYALIGIACSGYYLFYNARIRIHISEKIFLWFSLLWLIIFVIILSSLTGYIGLASLFLIFSISQISIQKHPILKILPISIIIICSWIVIDIVNKEFQYFKNPDTINFSSLESKTLLGNAYKPFNKNSRIENGHWVELYVCNKELYENWNKYSHYSLHGKDAKGHPLYHTLKRYMASLNLRKDASGLMQLSKEDIRNIESGCTNYRFTESISINHRIYEVFWEFHSYLQGKNPAGHSVTQRIEFLKCANTVFKQNLIWGTGPAYVMEKLNLQYSNQRVKLPQIYWRKPHNQFMLFAVQYGIVGLSIFIISLIGIIYFSRKNMSVISLCWVFICGTSFLNEDTLDGINGLVFFAFFGCLFLISQPFSREKHHIS